MMPPPPIPNRCLWCLKEPDVQFNLGHVMPECVGNERQQVLPPGIVCTSRNSDFSLKVEATLLDYPSFHVGAVFVRAVDPADGNAFRDQRPVAGRGISWQLRHEISPAEA